MKENFLVITSNSTGNNIFCTPAIRFIRKYLPDAVIDVVALSKLSAQVFAKNTDINQVHVTDNKRVLEKLCRQYTAVIALNKNAMKRFSGLSMSMPIAVINNDKTHHADQLLDFVSMWLSTRLHQECPILSTDRQYYVEPSTDLSHLPELQSIGQKDLVVNIHLGCGTTLLHGWKFFYAKRAEDKKLWPIDAYIELGIALQAKVSRLKIVITGTRNEAFLAKKFSKLVPDTINLVGKTTITDLRALMNQSNLFIAHDCGVLHVASASDVPILGLFGPTNSLVTGPYPQQESRQLIIKAHMSEITASEVLSRALPILGVS